MLLLGVVALELFLEVDARREERLSGEADGAGGDRPALAGGRLRLPRVAVVLVAGVARDVAQDLVALAGAEVIGVARLGHRHVRREDGAVGHPVEREDRAAFIRDADRHARRLVDRQPDHRARAERDRDRLVDDAAHLVDAQAAGDAAAARTEHVVLRRLDAVARLHDERAVRHEPRPRSWRPPAQGLPDAGDVRAGAEEGQAQPVDEDRAGRSERLREVEAAPRAGRGRRRRIFGQVRAHTGDADAAHDLAAAIDRDPAGVDRHVGQAVLAGVEHVGLAGRDPHVRQHAALVVEHRPAAGAAARIGRLARQRRRPRPRAEDAGDRLGARVRLVEDGVAGDVHLAAAVDVFDAVKRGSAGVRDAGRKVDAADEADGPGRERRLVVGEHRPRPRDRHRDVG